MHAATSAYAVLMLRMVNGKLLSVQQLGSYGSIQGQIPWPCILIAAIRGETSRAIVQSRAPCRAPFSLCLHQELSEPLLLPRIFDLRVLVPPMPSNMASLENFAATIQSLDNEMMALEGRLQRKTERSASVNAIIAGLREEQRVFAAEHAELATQTAEVECRLEDLQCISTSNEHAHSAGCGVQVRWSTLQICFGWQALCPAAEQSLLWAVQESYTARRMAMHTMLQAFLADCRKFRAMKASWMSEEQVQQMRIHAADVQAHIKRAKASSTAINEQLQAAQRMATSTKAESNKAAAMLTGASTSTNLPQHALDLRVVLMQGCSVRLPETKSIACAGVEGSLVAGKERQRRLQRELAEAEAAWDQRNKETERAECAAVMMQEAIDECATRWALSPNIPARHYGHVARCLMAFISESMSMCSSCSITAMETERGRLEATIHNLQQDVPKKVRLSL